MDRHLLVVAPTPAEQAYAAGLRDCGFALTFVASLAEAVRSALAGKPDAVLAVADDGAAPQLCEVLRAVGDFPLVLGKRALPAAVAAECLERGADAVVALPAQPRELAARLQAVIRRTADQTPARGGRRLVAGDLEIAVEARQVWWQGRGVDLTPTEFRLLTVLAETPGRVVPNRELLTRVWGPEYADDVHYVRLYIGYLRNKLGDDPHRPSVILNQWGVGYRLAEAVPAASIR